MAHLVDMGILGAGHGNQKNNDYSNAWWLGGGMGGEAGFSAAMLTKA